MDRLRQAQAEQGALDPRTLEEPLAAWGTRGALLLLCRTPEGRHIVVKWDRLDRPGVARAWFLAHRRHHELLAGSAVATVEPLGWTSSPACLFTGYVPGVDLDRYLGERAASPDSIRALRGCGTALGHYHANVAVPPDALTSSERHRLAARLKCGGRRTRLADSGRLVISAHDFAINNVRVARDGALVWLDPPSRRVITVREQDLAKFLVVLYRNAVLGRRDATVTTLGIPTTRRLEEAFLEGYAEAYPGPLDRRHLLAFSATLLRTLARKDVLIRRAWRSGLMTALWSVRGKLAVWAYPPGKRLAVLGR